MREKSTDQHQFTTVRAWCMEFQCMQYMRMNGSSIGNVCRLDDNGGIDEN
jgi:hypothetical protein